MNLFRKNKLSITCCSLLLGLFLFPGLASAQTIINVTSGQTYSGTVPGSAFLHSEQYKIVAPPGEERVYVTMTFPSSPEIDLDIGARQAIPVDYDAFFDIINADVFFEESTQGVEDGYVFGFASGDLYFAVIRYISPGDVSYQIKITLGSDISSETPTPTSTNIIIPPTNTPTWTPVVPTNTPTPTIPPAGDKTLSTGSYDINLGDTFDVLIKADQAENITGGQFRLNFESGAFQANSASLGASLSGSKLDYQIQNNGINIAFAHSLGAAAGSNQDLILISLSSLTMPGSGSSNITLSDSVIFNDNAIGFSVSPSNGAITVNDGGPTRTPFTNTPTFTAPPTGTATTPPTPTSTPQEGTIVWSVGNYQADPGASFDLVMMVNNSAGITGGECQIDFDNGILSAGAATLESSLSGFKIDSNPQSGNIKIAFANTTALGAGTDVSIIKIPMSVSGGATAGQSSNLSITLPALFNLDAGTLDIANSNGSFQVSGSTEPTPTTSIPTSTPTEVIEVTPTPGEGADPDLNGDQKVNHEDLRLLIEFIQKGNLSGDLNGDRVVDYADLMELTQSWNP